MAKSKKNNKKKTKKNSNYKNEVIEKKVPQKSEKTLKEIERKEKLKEKEKKKAEKEQSKKQKDASKVREEAPAKEEKVKKKKVQVEKKEAPETKKEISSVVDSKEEIAEEIKPAEEKAVKVKKEKKEKTVKEKKEKPAKEKKEKPAKEKKEKPVKEKKEKPAKEKKEKPAKEKVAKTHSNKKSFKNFSLSKVESSKKNITITIVAVLAVITIVAVILANLFADLHCYPNNYTGRAYPSDQVANIAISDEQQMQYVKATNAKGDKNEFAFYTHTEISMSGPNSEVAIGFSNPTYNDKILLFTIYDENDVLMYKSLGVTPGKCLNSIKFSDYLDVRMHEMTMYVSAFKYVDGEYELVGKQKVDLKIMCGTDYNAS